jgi:hypothetical protein
VNQQLAGAVGVFFDGVGTGESDDKILAIAPGYPVFRIVQSDRLAEV